MTIKNFVFIINVVDFKRRKFLMKNELVWTKTILTVYRYLERICGAIDKIIMQSALGSSNIVGQNYFYNNVYAISQKLIDLSERKVTLINLKVLIEDTLTSLESADAQILIEKYFDGVKFKDLAEKHDFSMRTVFRKVENAEKSFKSKLAFRGYNDVALKKFLEKEKWITNVYDSIYAKENDEFQLSNSFLAKAVSM